MECRNYTHQKKIRRTIIVELLFPVLLLLFIFITVQGLNETLVYGISR